MLNNGIASTLSLILSKISSAIILVLLAASCRNYLDVQPQGYVLPTTDDEFAAIVKGCTQDTLRGMIHRFEELEKKEGVSISLGYAYTDDIAKTTVQNLLDEADKYMYAQKKIVHEQS